MVISLTAVGTVKVSNMLDGVMNLVYRDISVNHARKPTIKGLSTVVQTAEEPVLSQKDHNSFLEKSAPLRNNVFLKDSENALKNRLVAFGGSDFLFKKKR